MAGYIFNLDSEDSLVLYTYCGVYTTKLKISPNTTSWNSQQLGTLCDYVSMRPGDNVYFFIKRKIYGIGELANIKTEVVSDCKFSNFPGASKPEFRSYEDIKSLLLWDEGEYSNSQRWICCFVPSPAFFKNGVDMDEVLVSDPKAFKMLRAFWRVSFIKIDDDENEALKSVILRKNLRTDKAFEWTDDFHKKVRHSLTADYKINIKDALLPSIDRQKMIFRQESALELYLVHALTEKLNNVISIFGEWDYISRQVIASPFKPVEYMDKMDIFGYRFLENYKSVKESFFVIELKKDTASMDDVDQLMKYVDWTKDEYAYGEYSSIKAFLVANNFLPDVVQNYKEIGKRIYTVGAKRPKTFIWNNLTLVKYELFLTQNQDINVTFKIIK